MIQIEDTKALGETVKAVRRAQGLTQEQLAAACGLGRRFVLELEAGKASIHVGKAMQVLSALGISLHAADRQGKV